MGRRPQQAGSGRLRADRGALGPSRRCIGAAVSGQDWGPPGLGPSSEPGTRGREDQPSRPQPCSPSPNTVLWMPSHHLRAASPCRPGCSDLSLASSGLPWPCPWPCPSPSRSFLSADVCREPAGTLRLRRVTACVPSGTAGTVNAGGRQPPWGPGPAPHPVLHLRRGGQSPWGCWLRAVVVGRSGTKKGEWPWPGQHIPGPPCPTPPCPGRPTACPVSICGGRRDPGLLHGVCPWTTSRTWAGRTLELVSCPRSLA